MVFDPFDPDYDPDQVNLPEITEGEQYPEEAAEAMYAEAAQEEPTPEEETMPEEITVANMFELIPIAIDQRRMLQVTYTSAHSGKTDTYTVEPYEIGGHSSNPGGYFWCFDIAVGRTKSFFLSNISDIQLLDTTYIPRWE